MWNHCGETFTPACTSTLRYPHAHRSVCASVEIWGNFVYVPDKERQRERERECRDRDWVCLVSVSCFLIQGPLCSKCNIKARWNMNKSNIAEAWRVRAERIRFTAEVKERLAEPLISANLSIRSNAKLRAAFHLALSYRHRAQGDILPCHSVPLFLFLLVNVRLRFDNLNSCNSVKPSYKDGHAFRNTVHFSGCPSGEASTGPTVQSRASLSKREAKNL